MKIHIKFFAISREIVGRSELVLSLPDDQTVADALNKVAQNHPDFDRLTGYLTAVNQTYAPSGTILKEGDELAIIPPVSGG